MLKSQTSNSVIRVQLIGSLWRDIETINQTTMLQFDEINSEIKSLLKPQGPLRLTFYVLTRYIANRMHYVTFDPIV